MKCFINFVQSGVNARREGDGNPKSSVVAERIDLFANSFYGYHIMDRSRHTFTSCLSEEKTLGIINEKMFKRFRFINEQLYKKELVQSDSEDKKPINVGFFVMLFAKVNARTLL